MPIDLNVSPYYDDYDDEKNYLQILFKPNVRVTAKELTQMQTIIADQIRKFGEHTFKHGSPVSGGQTSVDDVIYIKLNSIFNGNPVDLSALQDKSITISDIDDSTLIVKGYNADEGIIYVSFSTELYEVVNNETLAANTQILIEDAPVATTTGTDYGITKQCSVMEGIFFIEGRFVHVPNSTIFLKDFSDNNSGRFGFIYNTKFVTPEEDPTLNDTSCGQYDYSNEGNDRLAITTELVYFSSPEFDDSIDNFIELIEFDLGTRRMNVERSIYDDLGDTLAQRTYDESGNYTVEPFEVEIMESSNLDVFSIKKTGGNPKSITVTTNSLHDLDPGDPIIISGVIGDDADIYNGSFTVDEVISDVKFTYIVSKAPSADAPAEDPANDVSVDMFVERPDYYRARISNGKAYVYGYQIYKNDTTDLYETRARDVDEIQNYGASILDGTYVIASSNAVVNSGDVIFFKKTDGSNIGQAQVSYALNNGGNNTLIYFINYKELSGKNLFELDYIRNQTQGVNIQLANKKVQGNINNFIIDVAHSSVSTMSPNGQSDMSISTVKSYVQPAGINMSFYIGSGFFDGPIQTEIVGTSFEKLFTFSNTVAGKLDPTSIQIDSTGQTLTATFATDPGGDTYSFLSVQNNLVSSRTKELKKATITRTIGTDSIISLSRSDVYRIISVEHVENDNEDVMAQFDWNNGQRDEIYDHGYLINNSDINEGDSIRIEFEYFEHNGSGPITVDSYSIPYSDIPSYTTALGETFRLADVIDVRPYRQASSTNLLHTEWIPRASTRIRTDFEFYLPRRDRIVLYKNGKFDIIKGEPSLNPQLPPQPDDAMTIYELFLPEYTHSVDDIVVKFIDNKRYTMADIGRLEKRVEATEYYAALALLEIDTKNTPVYDGNSVERFKAGWLTDNFSHTDVGDIDNQEYLASIDPINKELRPSYDVEETKLEIQGSFGVHLHESDSGSFVTLPYTEEEFIRNLNATNWESVNPFLVIDLVGTMKMKPDSDTWVDTVNRPAVQADISNNRLLQTIPDNTSLLTGTALANRLSQESNRLGTDLSIRNSNDPRFSNLNSPNRAASRSVFNSLSQRWPAWELNVNGIDNNRAINSRFTATRTNTQALSFSNGNSSSSTIRNIRTNTTMNVGIDRIPVNTGNRLVDRNVIPFARAFETLVTVVKVKPNTDHHFFINNKKSNQFVTPLNGFKALSEGVVRSNADGIIQFRVRIPGGVFRTGDIHFKVSDNRTGLDEYQSSGAVGLFKSSGVRNVFQPVVVNIPVVRRDITTNTVDTTETTVTREVQVQAPRRDPLAQTFYVSPEKYPEGVMLSSIDLFFRSKGSKKKPVTVQIRPVVNGYPSSDEIIPYSVVHIPNNKINIPSNTMNHNQIMASPTNAKFDAPIYLETGREYSVVILADDPDIECYISHLGKSRLGGNKIVTSQPTLGSLFKSQNSSTWTAFQYEDLTFRLNIAKFNLNSNAVLTFENTNVLKNKFDINLVHFNPEIVDFEKCSVSHELTLKRSSNTGVSDKFILDKTSDKELPRPYYYKDKGDIKVITKFSTRHAYVSPFINLDKISFVAVENLINNSVTDETTPLNGLADAKYVTKPMILDDNFTANMVKVYLDAYVPEGTKFRAYAKIREAVDNRPYSEIPWIEMEANKTFVSENLGDFRELTFNLETQNEFKSVLVKLVMTSSNSSIVPKAKDLRVVTGAP